MFFLFLVQTALSTFDTVWDKYGVEFETKEHKTLVNTPKGLVDYIVPKTCETIKSGNKETLSSFYQCSYTLQTLSFEKGSKISRIDAFTFKSMEALLSVDFGNCLDLLCLNEWLFTYTSTLVTLILPPNVDSIMNYAFYGTAIEDVTLPDSCKLIGVQAFAWTHHLVHFRITENSQLETIRKEAFALSKITEFYFPQNLTLFFGSIFGGNSVAIDIHPQNKNFKKEGETILSANGEQLYVTFAKGHYEVPSSVKQINEDALRWTSITTIKFNSLISTVGFRWFAQSLITEIEIPLNVSTLSWGSFDRCYELVKCTLTEKVKIIDENAFFNCSKLASIDLLKVEEIGNFAFQLCTSLKTVSLPSSLTKLHQGVFSMCKGIVINSDNNENFYIADGILFSNKKTTLTEFFGTQKDIVIPEICTCVGSKVFLDKGIESVTFKNTNPIQIMDFAFSNSDITSLNIQTNVKSIGKEAFNSCSKLRSVVIKNLESNIIDEKTFINCKLLGTVELPASTESIKTGAFSQCSSLTTVNFQDTSLVSIGDSAFQETSINSLVLPTTFTTLGQRAFYRCKISSLDIKAYNIIKIPNYCFKECTFLGEVTFPDTLEDIGIEAFCGCPKIQSLVLPKAIRFVRERAFYNCISIDYIKLSVDCNLDIIYGMAFSNCNLLTEITIDPSDTKFTFDEGVLMDKDMTKIIFFLPSSKITTYVVPAHVKTIGPYSFQDCSNIKAVIIPNGDIREIGVSAFSGCTNLKYANIPKSITTVSNNIFNGCKSLGCGSIVCAKNVQQMILDSGYVKEMFFSDVCTPKNVMCSRAPLLPLLNLLPLITCFLIIS